MNAEEFLKEMGIHPTEPIFWDLGNKQISLTELIEQYHQAKLKELLPDDDTLNFNFALEGRDFKRGVDWILNKLKQDK